MEDVSDILDPLNEAQREAVAAPPGRTLVLAGAGSGKTRVLVHRAAWLNRVEGASPFTLMAVTFTNKAAAEMRGRIETLLGFSAAGMWTGTFHGLSHRLLRRHWREAGLTESFQILDSDDQKRLLRRVMRLLEIDEARFPPRQVQGYINSRKDDGQRPDDLGEGADPHTDRMIRIYRAYQEACERTGQVDFAELLLRSFELLRDNASLRNHYREQFRHVLVDEFQDTNGIQYAWLRMLAGPEADLFVVGDDDQSIYGWRGARVENIRRLTDDYPDVRVFRLEQNYRSTATILKAANALIDNNSGRMGKNLWTDGEDGEAIMLYAAFNDLDEARFVVDRLREAIADGHARSELAILYRSNAQSRLFEEALLTHGIPYRVYGGLRFFERAEIKDALAYTRLVSNPQDDASFERVVNTPPRGIGGKTVDLIREQSRARRASLWDAAEQCLQERLLPGRAHNAVTQFLALIQALGEQVTDQPLAEAIDLVIKGSGLRELFARDRDDRGESRLENLDELVSAARGFEQDWEGDGEMDTLTAFLAHAALEGGEGQAQDWQDCVQLMTLHSAKGLEFPWVCLAGLEEGLFPHRMSAEDPDRLEEERRLCYVGITRARRRLLMTWAEKRRLHGEERWCAPSRFISELPDDLIHHVRTRVSVSRPAMAIRRGLAESHEMADSGFHLGQRVMHPKFGEGVVLQYEGQGPSARIQVNFDTVGAKWLVASYAKLQGA
ncbi:DNA helicase-2/ATP-dependent DNA helicase PcrA [Natronocella acetinitrilica]|uniref:DNA 3'-5' helicase n=1 Tax=Natronocella acetinitrilica TaxID=414046 RepID=A0AAE3KBD0_9GAMM|nr:DNA helicase II [Natronocella acetinitrilica]MCP1673443.1 DNA helicase-2/ATP-dependent DNA helicase PcrA [Natronocella acetinitrilica]